MKTKEVYVKLNVEVTVKEVALILDKAKEFDNKDDFVKWCRKQTPEWQKKIKAVGLLANRCAYFAMQSDEEKI